MSASDDRELERYLKRGDVLSRAYAELRSERPSPALDQAVLARARDALDGQPRSQADHPRRWPAITALAATVLLSFALVMRLALEPDAQPQQSPGSTFESAPSIPAESAPMSGADRDSSPSESETSFATPPVSAPAPSPIEARRPDIESEIRAASEHAPAIVEPVLPQSLPRGSERAESAPAQAQAQRQAENDRARGIAAPAPRQKSPDRQRESSLDSPMHPDEALAKKESTKSPEAWLEEIKRLRAAGELEAAERELEQFKAVYPDYLELLQPHESEPEQR